MGFKRTITSLDNRQIVVQNDGVSQPGDQIRVPGEGFSVRNYGHRGDLFVTLDVHMPNKLSEERKEQWNEFFTRFQN